MMCSSTCAGASPDVALPLTVKETFAGVVPTSALTRQGLDALEEALLALAGACVAGHGGGDCPMHVCLHMPKLPSWLQATGTSRTGMGPAARACRAPDPLQCCSCWCA